jgi:integrase
VEEIERLFLELNGTSGLMLKLIYGTGLRLMDLARLRVKDVDFQNNVLLRNVDEITFPRGVPAARGIA